jgi:hypothetical protein
MIDVRPPEELREAGGRPAHSGKRYKTENHARAVAEYINRFGVQNGRYQWLIAGHEDGTYELWAFTSTRYVEWALAASGRATQEAVQLLREVGPLAPWQREQLHSLVEEMRHETRELMHTLDARRAELKLVRGGAA